MKKNILILCALSHEMKEIKTLFKSMNSRDYSLHFLLTGVGSYNVIYTLKKYLDTTEIKIDFILRK